MNTSPSPGTAAFVSADTDSDGMPDTWEIDYFGSVYAINGEAGDDWDQDGISNFDEYFTGTDPTDADAVFALQAAVLSSDCVFSWPSTAGKIYTLWICSDLVHGEFTITNSSIFATPPMNTFTSRMDDAECVFYRLTAEEQLVP